MEIDMVKFTDFCKFEKILSIGFFDCEVIRVG